jgi:hypothetical protein
MLADLYSSSLVHQIIAYDKKALRVKFVEPEVAPTTCGNIFLTIAKKKGI